MNIIRRIILVIGAALAVAPASGQLPGYEFMRLTDTPDCEGQLTMNNRRQIAFIRRDPGFDNATMEIMLYDDATGQTIQITDNSIQDLSPNLNEDGVLVWSAVMGQTPQGDPTAAIMVRTPDGTIAQLTDGDQTYDRDPVINIHGQIAWVRWDWRGCIRSARNIMFFDGQTIRRITDNDWGNQMVDLNDAGDIIWTEFNFCFAGFNWRSKIKLYRDGQILTLMDDDDLQAQATNINNVGICAWSSSDRNTGEQGVYLWDDGALTVLTDWGQRPIQNDLGDVALQRWHDDIETWQTWLYTRGRFLQASQETSVDNLVPAINDRRDLAWISGALPGDVIFLRRFDPGDLNCDGLIDAFDIDGFLTALFEPRDYSNRYPDCDAALADVNEDGSVNAFDIERFIELLFP